MNDFEKALDLIDFREEDVFNWLLKEVGLEVWMTLEEDFLNENAPKYLSIRTMLVDSGDYKCLVTPLDDIIKDRIEALDECYESFAEVTTVMAEELRNAASRLDKAVQERARQ